MEPNTEIPEPVPVAETRSEQELYGPTLSEVKSYEIIKEQEKNTVPSLLDVLGKRALQLPPK